MTRYLLDRDVMSQLDQPEDNRHANVRAWLASVDDGALYVSAITIVEAWKGFSTVRKRFAGDVERLRDAGRYEAAFEQLVVSLASRIVAIDVSVAKLWGTMLGERDKNRFDTCLAATAVLHDMVVATRNTADFRGRHVRLVDPFAGLRKIVEV